MTLNWTNIPFIFGSGLNTKVHPQQIPLGVLSELENGIFTNTGAINKRNGYSQLSNLILGQTNHISQAKASAVYNNIDLLTFDGNNVFSWIPSMTKWSDRGNCTAVTVEANNIVINSYQQTNPDVVVGRGVELYAWEDSRGGVRYSMIDATTGSKLVTDQLLNATGYGPQCLQFGDYLIIVYQTTLGQIIAALIAPGNPSNPSNYFLTSNADTIHPAFDLAQNDGYLYLVNSTNTTSQLVSRFDSTLTLVNSVDVPMSSATLALTAFIQSNNDIVVGFGNINGEVKLYSYNETLLSPIIPQALLDTLLISHITGIEKDTNLLFYYDNSTGIVPYIKSAITQSDGYNGANIFFKRSVSLTSKAWLYNERIYLNTVFDTDLQPTYFTLNELGEVVSKVQDGTAGGFRTASSLANINTVISGQFLLANEHKGIIQTQNGQEFQFKGVASADLQFSNSYKSAMLGNILHLTGGILQAYDGNEVVEHGFNVFPENILSVAGIGGFIDDGTYTWQFTYEWTNNVGDIERSAPSPGLTLTLSNGNNSVLFSIPSLCLTKKTGVNLVVYRTREASSGDPLLYRVSSIVTPTFNDPDSSYVLFTDSTNDSSITSNNILYCSPDTNGQLIELENIAAPNCTIISTYKNRIFLAGLDNTNQIWYSKTVVPGEPAGFNDTLVLDLDPKGGDITGLGVMDANLIIFKKESIFLISGIGPTNTGAQNDFIDPQMIASDVGCINQNSIVLVSASGSDMGGLFFQSSKGIYLLNRSLQASYVGNPVQDFNNQTIVSATQIPGTTQVRFLCSDGNALVYDYYVNQWSTFTNHIAVDAGVWQDTFFYLTSNGTVNQETPNLYLDGTIPINIKIATGWIQLGNLLNYQKINSFIFLGQFFGPHQLLVEGGYDGNENLSLLNTLNTNDIITQHIYGQQNVYGNNSPYGGSFANEIFRVFFKNPRCRSFKIAITEQQSSPGNQGLTLIAMNMKIGQKQGLDKVAPQNQSGLS